MPLGARFKWIEGVRGFYQSIAAAVPDLHIEVISEYDVPGCSVREAVITGTHKAEFAGVKPLGNAIRSKSLLFTPLTQDQVSSSQTESTTIKQAWWSRCGARKAARA